MDDVNVKSGGMGVGDSIVDFSGGTDGDGEDSEELFATQGVEGARGVDESRKGRKSNVERLRMDGMRWKSLSNLEGWRISSGSEGEMNVEERENKKRLLEGGEDREDDPFKKSRVTQRSPRGGGGKVCSTEETGGLTELIKSFQAQSLGKLEKLEQRGREAKKEMKENWCKWDRLWKGHCISVDERFLKMEMREEERDRLRESEMNEMKERMSRLERGGREGERWDDGRRWGGRVAAWSGVGGRR